MDASADPLVLDIRLTSPRDETRRKWSVRSDAKLFESSVAIIFEEGEPEAAAPTPRPIGGRLAAITPRVSLLASPRPSVRARKRPQQQRQFFSEPVADDDGDDQTELSVQFFEESGSGATGASELEGSIHVSVVTSPAPTVREALADPPPPSVSRLFGQSRAVPPIDLDALLERSASDAGGATPVFGTLDSPPRSAISSFDSRRSAFASLDSQPGSVTSAMSSESLPTSPKVGYSVTKAPPTQQVGDEEVIDLRFVVTNPSAELVSGRRKLVCRISSLPQRRPPAARTWPRLLLALCVLLLIGGSVAFRPGAGGSARRAAAPARRDAGGGGPRAAGAPPAATFRLYRIKAKSTVHELTVSATTTGHNHRKYARLVKVKTAGAREHGKRRAHATVTLAPKYGRLARMRAKREVSDKVSLAPKYGRLARIKAKPAVRGSKSAMLEGAIEEVSYSLPGAVLEALGVPRFMNGDEAYFLKYIVGASIYKAAAKQKEKQSGRAQGAGASKGAARATARGAPADARALSDDELELVTAAAISAGADVELPPELPDELAALGGLDLASLVPQIGQLMLRGLIASVMHELISHAPALAHDVAHSGAEAVHTSTVFLSTLMHVGAL